ncbi:hypothetical protein J6590_011882 [Homalodisca vitripennis]|nr:hypothetical protein J6590_011882 [Homalodisca vitripennis]
MRRRTLPSSALSTGQDGDPGASPPSLQPRRVPLDFFLFLLVKRKLKGRPFDSIGVIRKAVTDELKAIAEEEFKKCFQRCIDAQVSYFEENTGTYDLPAHRLNIFKKKPSYIGAKFWNLLPAHVAQLDIKSFRRGLMNWLMDRPFYSVQEFLRWKEDYNP